MVKTAKEKAEEFLSEWKLSQQDWAINALTILLKEQDRITRHACAEAIVSSGLAWLPKQGMDEVIEVNMAESIIMNTKAV